MILQQHVDAEHYGIVRQLTGIEDVVLAMSNNSPTAAVRAAISNDLKTAVKARDSVSISALRAVLSALDNAGVLPLDAVQPAPHGSSAEVARGELSGAEIEAMLLDEIERYSAAASEYERVGHPRRADRLRLEAAVIRGTLQHLPAVDSKDLP